MTGPVHVLDASAALAIDEWSEGWYSIHADALSEINGASVEGTRAEMESIAAAIELDGYYTAKRCAVDARHTEDVLLWSPRNSTYSTRVTRKQADNLAQHIRETFATASRDAGVPGEPAVAQDGGAL